MTDREQISLELSKSIIQNLKNIDYEIALEKPYEIYNSIYKNLDENI